MSIPAAGPHVPNFFGTLGFDMNGFLDTTRVERTGELAHKRAPWSVAGVIHRRHRMDAPRPGDEAVCQPCATFRGVSGGLAHTELATRH